MSNQTITLMTPADLLKRWQQHRALTRQVIEAYPADQRSTHHAPDMRPFSALIQELIGITQYELDWARTGTPAWNDGQEPPAVTGDMLDIWDRQTAELNEVLPTLTDEFWHRKVQSPFGEMTYAEGLFYVMDNEIHHRGQCYVYLRELGVTPPKFEEAVGIF